MGFRVELTTGSSIAVASPKRTGAAVIVDIDTLLELEGGKRAKSLQDRTDRKLTGNAAATLRGASTVEDIVAAFGLAVDRDATRTSCPVARPFFSPRTSAGDPAAITRRVPSPSPSFPKP